MIPIIHHQMPHLPDIPSPDHRSSITHEARSRLEVVSGEARGIIEHRSQDGYTVRLAVRRIAVHTQLQVGDTSNRTLIWVCQMVPPQSQLRRIRERDAVLH